MAGLCRTSSGIFKLDQAYDPDYIQDLVNPAPILISCEDILKNFTDKKISLDAFYSKLAKNGAEIYLHKLNRSADNPGEKVLMYDEKNKLFALGEIKLYENGPACKARIFV